MAFRFEDQVGIVEDDPREAREFLASQLAKGEATGIEEDVSHLDDQAAIRIAGLQHAVEEGEEARAQFRFFTVGAFGGRYILSLPQGAAHASELFYLFIPRAANPTDEQKALQATMAAYWTNFARTGDPNGAGVPDWAAFARGRVQALDVASGGGVTGMTADAFRDQHHCLTAWSGLTF